MQELPEDQRSDAVSSMVYEANARVRDPVYGCVGAISSLQQQVDDLQTQLALAQAEVVHMKMRQHPPSSISSPSTSNYPPSTINHHYHHHHDLPSQTKSFFPMDMVHEIDHQATMGESLWSY